MNDMEAIYGKYKATTCEWTVNNQTFTFCGAPVLPYKCYCEKHYDVAYVFGKEEELEIEVPSDDLLDALDEVII
jgi:hypothetical protein